MLDGELLRGADVFSVQDEHDPECSRQETEVIIQLDRRPARRRQATWNGAHNGDALFIQPKKSDDKDAEDHRHQGGGNSGQEALESEQERQAQDAD